MDRGARQATVHGVTKELDTTTKQQHLGVESRGAGPGARSGVGENSDRCISSLIFVCVARKLM